MLDFLVETFWVTLFLPCQMIVEAGVVIEKISEYQFERQLK